MKPAMKQSGDRRTEKEADAALTEFFSAVRTAARETACAVEEGKPALARITGAIAGHDNGQALRVRSILVSLYTGGAVLADVSELMALDWSLRKDVCAVLLAFGHGEFGYEFMKSAFECAGGRNAQWFLSAVPDPAERLHEALAFAKPGPLTSTARTLTEGGMAELLLSLFRGARVDMGDALKSFDRVRAALVTGIISDYIAGRFDSSATELVMRHFEAA